MSDAKTAILSTRVTPDYLSAIDTFAKIIGDDRGTILRDAVDAYMNLRRTIIPIITLPTDGQRAGMRMRALMVLRKVVEIAPSDLGEHIGCSETAAGAYCRDLRKIKYGGHDIKSRPVIVNGRRISLYRLNTEGE